MPIANCVAVLLANCVAAIPRAKLDAITAQLDDTFMANVNMLQLQEQLPQGGSMRIEKINRALGKIEMAVEEALQGGYEHALLVHKDEVLERGEEDEDEEEDGEEEEEDGEEEEDEDGEEEEEDGEEEE